MTVREYHERSKNRPGRPAPAPAEPDRSIGPVPFRRFIGADLVPLDEASPEALPAAGGVSLAAVSRLFRDSLAISLWREEGGARISFRVNPSAGNLHPIEAYLLAGSTLYHYSPFDHALEVRARLAEGLPADLVLAGITTILWRTAWKYGERAFRLAHLDAGHALAALTFAAAGLGWRARPVDVADDDLAVLLGIDGQSGPEAEQPVALLALGCGPPAVPVPLPRRGEVFGRPNRISPGHRPWPGVDEIAAATRRPPGLSLPPLLSREEGRDAEDLSAVQRRRRSATAFTRGISRAELCRLLSRAQACADPLVRLGLLVHRVEGLEPGAYRFPPLQRLSPLHTCTAALAGGQAFAADAAFVAVMLGDLEPALAEGKAWLYRRLHWAAGAVGHTLHLEAVALGLGARGIGGFVDELVHRALGLPDDGRWQALYLLAVGGVP